MKNFNKIYALLAITFATFVRCNSDEVVKPTPLNTDNVTQTGVLLSVDLDAQGLYPLHIVENVEEGVADITGAQELLNSAGAIMIATKDGFIYINDYTGSTFKKLQVNENGVLTEVASVPNLGTNGSPLHTFLDDERVLLTSRQTYPEDGVISYQVINTTSMTEESTGKFELPIQGASNANFSYMYANQYIYFEGNIYIPFVEAGDDDNLIYDKAYVAIYNATDFKYVKTINTPFTAALGNGFNPSFVINEAGDLYMGSSNTNLYAPNEKMPAGVVRIKSGQTDFDANYFLNFTEATGDHTLGLLNIGNNKAIIQSFNKEAITAEKDYIVEYSVVDLVTKSITKLNIPASKSGYFGARRSMDVLGNGNAAILTNSESGNHVYIYNPIENELKKGITYTGADAIVGLKAI